MFFYAFQERMRLMTFMHISIESVLRNATITTKYKRNVSARIPTLLEFKLECFWATAAQQV